MAIRGKDKRTTYKVRSGDNWFNVAERLKTQANSLLKANPAVKRLVPGQVVRAPSTPRPYAPTSYMAPRPPAALTARPAQTGETEEQQWARVREMRFPTPVQPPKPAYAATSYMAPRKPTVSSYAPTSYMASQPPRTNAAATKTPIPGRQTGTRAQSREKQKTFANTYTNLDYVQIAMNSGQLPLVVRPATAQTLGLDENYLAELGYTQDNDYGYWIRPMYEQQTGLPAAAVDGAGAGAGGGGGYGGYGGYGDGGGGYGSSYPIDYAVQNARRQTGYSAGNQNNQFGSMPLVSWRI